MVGSAQRHGDRWGGELLVADLTELHRVDLATGDLLETAEVAGAVFLNDVSSDGEQAFISDFIGHGIYHYADGVVQPWLKVDQIQHPNGLLVNGEPLLMASWDKGMREDFSTEIPGSLFAVKLSTQGVAGLLGAHE